MTAYTSATITVSTGHSIYQGLLPYPHNSVQGLTHDSQFAYAGTYGEGVWRRPLSDFGIPVSVQTLKEEPFKIFPNPARRYFMVAFKSLPDADSDICIYNNAGQKVTIRKWSGKK
jgi:hypothetical protein